MSNDLSPDWLSTGDEQASSPSEQSAAASAPVRIQVSGHRRVSRAPAAAVGILGVFVVGLFAFGGADALVGQVPGIPAKKLETAIEIRITDDGIEPRTVNAAPGQKIVWINEQGIPHILESETLLGDNGSFLYTPAIFPGSDQEFWISEAQEEGRHSYLSTTSVDVYGEINVTTDASAPLAAPMEEEEEEQLEEDFGAGFENEEFEEEAYEEDVGESEEDIGLEEFEEQEEEEVVVMPDELPETIDNSDPLAPVGSVTGTPETSGNADQEALIPFNPYKVGSDKTGPNAGPLHGGAPLISRPGFKPYRNTDTGPALWIVSGLSVAALFWATRKYFAVIQK